ncbi:MAG: hypothetical protein JO040_15670, partial [Gemmatimonadetes bacterium]|nr:hypothetical protein [Gemmatimonadota bacterium]
MRTPVPTLLLALLPYAAAPQQARAQAPRLAGWNTDFATLAEGAPARNELRLARGLAYLPELSLRDGVVEFDLPSPTRGLFVGVAFRMQSASDYEIVYFRAPDEGRWGEIQYQGVWQGETTWQLYPGEGYQARLPEETRGPLHVRLVVSGRRADVYLNGAAEPALRIPELKRTPAPGAVGFWTVSVGNPQGMTAVSGLRVQQGVATPLPRVPLPATPRGQLVRWRVSGRLPAPDSIAPPRELTPEMARAVEDGYVVEAEGSGLVNLTRAVGNPAGAQRSNVFGGAGWGLALARVVLVSDRAQVKRLRLGYSEGAGVFLNGARVFAGSNAYGRVPGALGEVRP